MNNDDAADAHILAAYKLQENPDLSGKIYFISQGESVLAWEMVNALLKAAGCSPVKKSILITTPASVIRLGIGIV